MKEDTRIKGKWMLSDIRLKDGVIKFRLNNDWNINYGDNGSDIYLDQYGQNIPVKEGVYDIELDVTIESSPRYQLIKKL